MLNPRWAVLVVTPLAMCLIVRASQRGFGKSGGLRNVIPVLL
jgi:hypothetical protein